MRHKATMKERSKRRGRSWATTVVATLVAMAAFYISVASFKLNIVDMLISIAFGLFGLLAIGIAIRGRSKTLGSLFDTWIDLP